MTRTPLRAKTRLPNAVCCTACLNAQLLVAIYGIFDPCRAVVLCAGRLPNAAADPDAPPSEPLAFPDFFQPAGLPMGEKKTMLLLLPWSCMPISGDQIGLACRMQMTDTTLGSTMR